MEIKTIFSKIWGLLICLIAAILFSLFFFQTLSPLFAFELCDSSVFKLMGLAILHGKVPYVDLFDHKGPMLYLIQAIGQWLVPGRNGLFLLSILAISVSVICWYKSARLFTSPLKSVIVVLLSLLTYSLYSEYGNLSEDWNVPFISISYYLILSFLLKKQDKKLLLNGCIIGLCLAGSFLIRPNDAVAFIGAPIAGAIIWLLKERNIKECMKWVGGIVIGALIVFTMFVIWFAIHKALPDLYYGLIGFNAKYASGIVGLLEGGMELHKLNYLPFIIVAFVLTMQLPERSIVYVFTPTALAAYVLLGNNAYPHYWIVWIPVLFFSFWLFAIIQQNKAFMILAICVFLSLPIFDNKSWLKFPQRVGQQISHNMHSNDSIAFYTKDLFNTLQPQDKDSIWSYNLTWDRKVSGAPNAFNVLLYNEIIPCNRVPLVFMADRDESLLESMDITKFNPKYILYSQQHVEPASFESRDSAFITQNYHIAGTSRKPKIIFYKRNIE